MMMAMHIMPRSVKYTSLYKATMKLISNMNGTTMMMMRLMRMRMMPYVRLIPFTPLSSSKAKYKLSDLRQYGFAHPSL